MPTSRFTKWQENPSFGWPGLSHPALTTWRGEPIYKYQWMRILSDEEASYVGYNYDYTNDPTVVVHDILEAEFCK